MIEALVIFDADDQAAIERELRQFLGLRVFVDQRLDDADVQVVFQRGLGHFVMQLIGRGDQRDAAARGIGECLFVGVLDWLVRVKLSLDQGAGTKVCPAKPRASVGDCRKAVNCEARRAAMWISPITPSR